MRSLTLKLTLAFLTVGLVGALLMALFVGQRTQRAYEQFVAARGRDALVAALARYYATHGGWAGVETVLQRLAGQPEPQGGAPPPLPFVVIDATNRVVVGNPRYPTGARLVPAVRARGVPIEVDGRVVGWVVFSGSLRRPGPDSPEAAFFGRVRQAIIYSAIGATALALLLGSVLARTLTQPLRELTAATQAVARGALGRQVAVRSQDELGTLAASFNQMSADLARASALRRQMTADIAHDLRTPLSVILGYTEALREGKLPPDQEIFETLHGEAQHLQRLVDDLRTLSLADAGELPLMRQPLAPRQMLERAAAAYRAQASARGIALHLQAAPDLPTVQVDPKRMAQVLGNLLSNALRYTPAGGRITLAAATQGDRLLLQVQDTGSGIAPEDLPYIFERFYRADPARQQHDGSSGLGLAIARSLVEAHGGTITVTSQPGQGTTFTISLPLSDPPPRVSRPAPADAPLTTS